VGTEALAAERVAVRQHDHDAPQVIRRLIRRRMKLLHANDTPGVHAPSWYAATFAPAERPPLEDNIDADICIIGGGYTGLAAAHEAALSGHSVVVLEAHRVGWGASGRNGGQLGSGFNQDQRALEAAVGRDRAHALWNIVENTRSSLLALSVEQGIDVQYRPGIVTALHRARKLASLHDYCEFLARNYPDSGLEPLDRTALRSLVASDDYHGGAIDRHAGHLHPLRLAAALASAAEGAGAVLHERSEVLRVDVSPSGTPARVVTALGSVRADHVVLAANGYLDDLSGKGLHGSDLPGDISSYIMPINNFILVTEPLGVRALELLPGDHAVADSRFVVNYFRLTPDRRLLFGGGENYRYRFPRDMVQRTRAAMLGVFPKLGDTRTDFAWGGTLSITRSRLPFVKSMTPFLHCAGGYSGHGIVLASACGRAIARAIDGDAEHMDLLSALPTGRFPGGLRARPALLAGALSTARLLDRL